MRVTHNKGLPIGHNALTCPECKEYQREIMAGTLATELLDKAQQKVRDEILADFKKRLSDADRLAQDNKRFAQAHRESASTLESRQEGLDAAVQVARSAYEALEKVFKQPAVSGPFQKYVGKLFFLDSKTGGKGHFLEVDSNGNLKCSCTAAAFDNECWAKRHIASNLARGDTSWRYDGSKSNFDARVRKAGYYFRIPNYTTRPYSKYVTIR